MRKTFCFLALVVTVALLAPRAWADQSQARLLQLYVIDGGWIVWCILVPLSVVTIVLAIGNLLSIRATSLIPEIEYKQLQTLLTSGHGRRAQEFLADRDSFLADVVAAGLRHAAGGTSAAVHAAEEIAEQRTVRLFRKVEILNVIGNIAPMIGLFGTVYGMIMSFQQMAAAAVTQRPVEVAAEGIRTALVTTFWGLLVGIPALCVYALFRNKIEALASNGMLQAEELLEGYQLAIERANAAAKPKE